MTTPVLPHDQPVVESASLRATNPWWIFFDASARLLRATAQQLADVAKQVSEVAIRTQNVVTGSRTIGTTYQNTSGRPMFVNVCYACNPAQGIAAYTDATTPPGTHVAGEIDAGSGVAALTVSFWVLAGNYYRVTAGTGSLISWIEWV